MPGGPNSSPRRDWPALPRSPAAVSALGFFSWYAFLDPRTARARSPLEATLLFALALGRRARARAVGCVRALLRAPHRHLARVPPCAGTSPSWATLCLLWLTFAAPAGLATAGPRDRARRALFCVGESARRGALQRDGPRRAASTFVVTRAPIIIIAELAAVIIGQRAGVHFSRLANPAARRVGALGRRALHRHRAATATPGPSRRSSRSIRC